MRRKSLVTLAIVFTMICTFAVAPVITASAADTTTTTEEEEKNKIYPVPKFKAMVGGINVTSWDGLNNILMTYSLICVEKGKLVSVICNPLPNYSTISAETFKYIGGTEILGLHVDEGSGTAVTFINDEKIALQPTVDMAFTTAYSDHKKTVYFNTTSQLVATTILHASAPAGTKTVTVYKLDDNGNKTLFTTLTPTTDGLFCFYITETCDYELDY